VSIYVIRLLLEQYFEGSQVPKAASLEAKPPAVVGENAFVLYRSHESFEKYPPMKGWTVRRLVMNGVEVKERGNGATDEGHYVLRLPTLGGKEARDEGPPQGLFATEYCDEDTNFLCKCVLAWQTVIIQDSPYSLEHAGHLEAILPQAGLQDLAAFEGAGVIRNGRSCCPLCLRIIRFEELHKMVTFDDACGLENAGIQIEGATRSAGVRKTT
jgi:hypothetical protein